MPITTEPAKTGLRRPPPAHCRRSDAADGLRRGAGAHSARADPVGANAGSHLQSRGELRRRRCARRRPGGQLRPRYQAGGFSGAGGRQAAEGADLRHGRHSEHPPAQASVPGSRRAADRARRRRQQTGARRPPLSDRARRLSCRAAAHRRMSATSRAASSREAGAGRSGGCSRHERPAAASQDFTQNRRLLLEAVDNFVGQKLPSAGVARNEKMSRQMDAAGQPTDDAGDPITIDPANRYVRTTTAQPNGRFRHDSR